MQDYTGSEIIVIVLVGAVVFGVLAGLITAAVMRWAGGRVSVPKEPTLEEGVEALRAIVAKAKALVAEADAAEAEAKAAREAADKARGEADKAKSLAFEAQVKLDAMEEILRKK